MPLVSRVRMRRTLAAMIFMLCWRRHSLAPLWENSVGTRPSEFPCCPSRLHNGPIIIKHSGLPEILHVHAFLCEDDPDELLQAEDAECKPSMFMTRLLDDSHDLHQHHSLFLCTAELSTRLHLCIARTPGAMEASTADLQIS